MSDTEQSATVLYEIEGGVVTLTLNRPDRLNAWTPEMQQELYGALDRILADPEARVVVLTGAGRGFCGGADMSVLQVASAETETGSRPLLAPMWFPKPIIAAINGPCAGIGLQLALMCDVRIAARSAKFTTSFARRGLIAEHGLSWLLPKITSMATAAELLLSARVFLAEEAKELGVIHRVVDEGDALSEALEYARDLADNVSPTAMAVIKWQVYNHADAPLLDVVDDSDALMFQSLERPDLAEGVASFMEKRKPNFPPVLMDHVPPNTPVLGTKPESLATESDLRV